MSFGDQLKFNDGAIIRLQCSHEYTGGEMKCKHCGMFANNVIKNQIMEHTEINWTDGLDYLKSHDV